MDNHEYKESDRRVIEKGKVISVGTGKTLQGNQRKPLPKENKDKCRRLPSSSPANTVAPLMHTLQISRGSYLGYRISRGGYLDDRISRGGYLDDRISRGGYLDDRISRGGYLDDRIGKGGYLDCGIISVVVPVDVAIVKVIPI